MRGRRAAKQEKPEGRRETEGHKLSQKPGESVTETALDLISRSSRVHVVAQDFSPPQTCFYVQRRRKICGRKLMTFLVSLLTVKREIVDG